MHVDVFFSIYREKTARFRSWRQLLDMSLITIMDAERQKARNAEILFVTHEWASRSHPDPQGIQLRCLYDTLKKMSQGHFSRYGTNVQSVFAGHWRKDVRRDFFFCLPYLILNPSKRQLQDPIDWKTKLKRLYLWIDYQSIPQISERPTDLGKEMDREATAAEEESSKEEEEKSSKGND